MYTKRTLFSVCNSFLCRVMECASWLPGWLLVKLGWDALPVIYSQRQLEPWVESLLDPNRQNRVAPVNNLKTYGPSFNAHFKQSYLEVHLSAFCAKCMLKFKGGVQFWNSRFGNVLVETQIKTTQLRIKILTPHGFQCRIVIPCR